MFWIPLALAATAALKAATVDSKNANEQNKLKAETMRYKPLTGANPDAIQVDKPDLIGNTLQGALTGMSISQGLNNSDMMNKIVEKNLTAPVVNNVVQEAIQETAKETNPFLPKIGKFDFSNWKPLYNNSLANFKWGGGYYAN